MTVQLLMPCAHREPVSGLDLDQAMQSTTDREIAKRSFSRRSARCRHPEYPLNRARRGLFKSPHRRRAIAPPLAAVACWTDVLELAGGGVASPLGDLARADLVQALPNAAPRQRVR